MCFFMVKHLQLVDRTATKTDIAKSCAERHLDVADLHVTPLLAVSDIAGQFVSLDIDGGELAVNKQP